MKNKIGCLGISISAAQIQSSEKICLFRAYMTAFMRANKLGISVCHKNLMKQKYFLRSTEATFKTANVSFSWM